MNKHLLIALILSASAIAYSSQQSGSQPHVSNTQFNTEPVDGAGLSATVTRFQHAYQQLWIGYEVPALPNKHFTSCSDQTDSSASDDGCCGEYQLENARNSMTSTSSKQAEPTNPASMDMLLRLDQGAVTKVRFVNTGCHLNAGGVPFKWLTGVQPDDSVNFLGQLISQSPIVDSVKHVVEGALAALAMHATPTATKTLASFTTPTNESHLREKAAFWLGSARGHDGFLVLQKLIKDEPDQHLREKLTFDLSINADPAATDELLALAKSDPDPKVRSQAIFWLAQKAGKKSSAAIVNAIENDPDLQVKKKAIFAVSQLPDGQGVPELIHVADTSHDPELRKQAMFWLGQSKDPRALQYIEAVLKR